MIPNSDDVVGFWFEELTPKQWWVKDEALDAEICSRFGALHAAAVAAELWPWRQSAEGRLAEVLVLDQFSRNIYRDRPESFRFDPMALALAQEAIGGGHDQEIEVDRRVFLYLPFMHSESLAIHEEAVRLYTAAGQQQNLDFEYRHKAIIERFGRYPHRNAILGRDSTPEEQTFLEEPGSSF